MLKTKDDNPSIGILLCNEKNKVKAEYALKDINKPIGISEYELIKAIPEDLKSNLPTVEEIEQVITEKIKKSWILKEKIWKCRIPLQGKSATAGSPCIPECGST